MQKLQLGMIGMGRMGGNMAERLRRKGHTVIGYDRSQDVSDTTSLNDLVTRLTSRRIVWVMLAHGPITDQTMLELYYLLDDGDLVINGANGPREDDLRYAELLAERGIHYVDAGVSGGVWGLKFGYGLMVGGANTDVRQAMPIFRALKPRGKYGFVHAGPVGAGHYAKMAHNALEYIIMHGHGEIYELLRAAEADGIIRTGGVPAIFNGWRSGTVVRSWLLDLFAEALNEDPDLNEIDEGVPNGGEGRWAVAEAVRLQTPFSMMALALSERFASVLVRSLLRRSLNGMRSKFGGHSVKKK